MRPTTDGKSFRIYCVITVLRQSIFTFAKDIILPQNRTMAEMTGEFGVHANQISKWNEQLQKGLPENFAGDGSKTCKISRN